MLVKRKIKREKIIERAVFIGEPSQSTSELLEAIRPDEFQIELHFVNTAAELIRTCFKLNNMLLFMELDPESISAYLNAMDIKFIAEMTLIAFTGEESESLKRICKDIGVDRLVVRTDSLKKDASALSDYLMLRLHYRGFDLSKLTRGHIISEDYWHDAETQIIDYDKCISDDLEKLGVRRELAGHKYLISAVAFAASTFVPPAPKLIYAMVAEYYGVKPASVEKAIRYAIEYAWTNGDIYTQHSMFGLSIDESKGKPTNAEFISRLALEFVHR